MKLYIRYEGKIGKYKSYIGNDRDELYTYDFTTFEIDSDDIEDEIIDLYNLKVSHNLIDLIEVGDYVNGRQVYFIKDDELYEECIHGMCQIKDIKSILTHEQYEANCYKVVE